MAPVGDVSPDGRWYWDGQRWVSAVTPDGAWQWNGVAWVAAVAPPSNSVAGGLLGKVPGFRSRVPWKMGVAAVAYLAIAGIVLFSVGSALAGSPGARPTSTKGNEPIAQVAGPSPSPTASTATGHLPSPSPKQSPSPSPRPVAKPSPKPVAKASPKPAPPKSTCGAPANPWGYNFCGGGFIYSPPASFCAYFNCIPSFWKSTLGYVDECNDGTYSHSGGRQGACSYHHGERRPLYA
jgi:hypothetical protein